MTKSEIKKSIFELCFNARMIKNALRSTDSDFTKDELAIMKAELLSAGTDAATSEILLLELTAIMALKERRQKAISFPTQKVEKIKEVPSCQTNLDLRPSATRR